MMFRSLGCWTLLVIASPGDACSRSSNDAEAPTKVASSVACDEAATLAAVDRMGKHSFPDDPGVDYVPGKHELRDGLRFVEVEPSGNVGYPKFLFAIECDQADDPRLRGVYAFEKGSYSLLFTTDRGELPATPAWQP
jgi:hypothetical protein